MFLKGEKTTNPTDTSILQAQALPINVRAVRETKQCNYRRCNYRESDKARKNVNQLLFPTWPEESTPPIFNASGLEAYFGREITLYVFDKNLLHSPVAAQGG